MVENLPPNVGDTGLLSGPGRFHVLQGNQARAPQILTATYPEPVLCDMRSHHNEEPQASQLEKDLAQQQRPRAVKDK